MKWKTNTLNINLAFRENLSNYYTLGQYIESLMGIEHTNSTSKKSKPEAIQDRAYKRNLRG